MLSTPSTPIWRLHFFEKMYVQKYTSQGLFVPKRHVCTNVGAAPVQKGRPRAFSVLQLCFFIARLSP